MQQVMARWRGCGPRDEAARRELYLATPPQDRVALLELICELEQWSTLVWAVRDVGILPGQVWALDGARALGDHGEPLWIFLWLELAGLGLDPSLSDRVLEVLSEGGASTLYMSAERGGATRLLEDLFARQPPVIRRGELIGPMNALWSAAPLWSTRVQLLCAESSAPLAQVEEVLTQLRPLTEAAERGVARAQQWVRWLIEALVRSDASWQPALELLWGAAADEGSAVHIWARQEFLYARGGVLRWLDPQVAARLAGVASREAALLGLPWSLDALLAQLRTSAARAPEYVWMISTTPELSPEISRALGSVIRLQHTRMEGVVLASMLAALPRGTSRWAEPLWLELSTRPEAVVKMELCRLIARLGLTGGRSWLESQLRSGGLRLQEEALGALREVGDERSAQTISDLIAQRPELTMTGQQVLEVVRDRRAASLDEVGAAPPGALAPRAAPSGLAAWSGVAMAPREVSAEVLKAQHEWINAGQMRQVLRAGIVWPVALLCALLLWAVVPLPWQVATVVENVLGAWLVMTLICAPFVVFSWLLKLPAEERTLLESGDALLGDVVEVGGVRQVTFRDLAGVSRSAMIRKDQYESAPVGARVQLMHLRSGEVDHVLLTPALEGDERGVLVPAAAIRERSTMLEVGSTLLWLLCSLPGLFLLLSALFLLMTFLVG